MKIWKTTLGLGTLAAGAGAGYVYVHPELLPPEARSYLEKYNLLKEDAAHLHSKFPEKNFLHAQDIPSMLKLEPKQHINKEIKEDLSVSAPFSTKQNDDFKELDVPEPLVKVLEFKPYTPVDEKKIVKDFEERLLNCLQETENAVKIATQAKYKTIEAIKNHAKTLKQAVDDGQHGDWTAVNTALTLSENLAKRDIQDENTARNHLDNLRKIISAAKNQQATAKCNILFIGSETLNKLNHQLDELNFLAEKSRNERRIFNQYKDLIEKSRQHFAQELNSIVPGIDVNSKEDTLTKDELNALIAHAYLRVKEEQNIAKAIDDQRLADQKIAESQLDLELRRVRESNNVDVEKKVYEQRKVWEQELETRLLRASQAHSEHLASVLRTQKKLHDIENAKLVEEAVNEQKEIFNKEVACAMAKINGIETALQSRDLENRKTKQFWLSCQNLNESIVYGQKAGDTIEKRRKPLQHELNIIKEVTGNDNFVQSIINYFPKDSLSHGVYTEQDLKNRFSKIYKLARRTAQIDDNGGGSLLKYISSYIQSYLIIELPTVYPANDGINVDQSDTYGLLSRAKYFVENGDLKSAIALLNLLKGAPARLAQDWISDALTFLETKFLAEILLAHSTVNSIRQIY